MKLFVFGSLSPGDDIAPRVARALGNGFQPVFTDDPAAIIGEKQAVILDAVRGIRKVTVLSGVKSIKGTRLSSLHDFDLGYFLRLADELGIVPEITVVGLPMEGDFNAILKDARASLRQLQARASR